MESVIRSLIDTRESRLRQLQLVSDGLHRHPQFAEPSALGALGQDFRRVSVAIVESVRLWRSCSPSDGKQTVDGIRDSASSNAPASPFAPFLWAAPNGAEPVPYLQKMISDCYFIRQNNALCNILQVDPSSVPSNPLLAPSALSLPTAPPVVPAVTAFLANLCLAADQRAMTGGSAFAVLDAGDAADMSIPERAVPSPITAMVYDASAAASSMHTSLAISSRRVVSTAVLVGMAGGEPAAAGALLKPDDILSTDARALLRHAHVRALVDRMRLVRAHAWLAEEAARAVRAAEVESVTQALVSAVTSVATMPTRMVPGSSPHHPEVPLLQFNRPSSRGGAAGAADARPGSRGSGSYSPTRSGVVAFPPSVPPVSSARSASGSDAVEGAVGVVGDEGDGGEQAMDAAAAARLRATGSSPLRPDGAPVGRSTVNSQESTLEAQPSGMFVDEQELDRERERAGGGQLMMGQQQQQHPAFVVGPSTARGYDGDDAYVVPAPASPGVSALHAALAEQRTPNGILAASQNGQQHGARPAASGGTLGLPASSSGLGGSPGRPPSEVGLEAASFLGRVEQLRSALRNTAPNIGMPAAASAAAASGLTPPGGGPASVHGQPVRPSAASQGGNYGAAASPFPPLGAGGTYAPLTGGATPSSSSMPTYYHSGLYQQQGGYGGQAVYPQPQPHPGYSPYGPPHGLGMTYSQQGMLYPPHGGSSSLIQMPKGMGTPVGGPHMYGGGPAVAGGSVQLPASIAVAVEANILRAYASAGLPPPSAAQLQQLTAGLSAGSGQGQAGYGHGQGGPSQGLGPGQSFLAPHMSVAEGSSTGGVRLGGHPSAGPGVGPLASQYGMAASGPRPGLMHPHAHGPGQWQAQGGQGGAGTYLSYAQQAQSSVQPSPAAAHSPHSHPHAMQLQARSPPSSGLSSASVVLQPLPNAAVATASAYLAQQKAMLGEAQARHAGALQDYRRQESVPRSTTMPGLPPPRTDDRDALASSAPRLQVKNAPAPALSPQGSRAAPARMQRASSKGGRQGESSGARGSTAGSAFSSGPTGPRGQEGGRRVSSKGAGSVASASYGGGAGARGGSVSGTPTMQRTSAGAGWSRASQAGASSVGRPSRMSSTGGPPARAGVGSRAGGGVAKNLSLHPASGPVEGHRAQRVAYLEQTVNALAHKVLQQSEEIARLAAIKRALEYSEGKGGSARAGAGGTFKPKQTSGRAPGPVTNGVLQQLDAAQLSQARRTGQLPGMEGMSLAGARGSRAGAAGGSSSSSTLTAGGQASRAVSPASSRGGTASTGRGRAASPASSRGGSVGSRAALSTAGAGSVRSWGSRGASGGVGGGSGQRSPGSVGSRGTASNARGRQAAPPAAAAAADPGLDYQSFPFTEPSLRGVDRVALATIMQQQGGGKRPGPAAGTRPGPGQGKAQQQPARPVARASTPTSTGRPSSRGRVAATSTTPRLPPVSPRAPLGEATSSRPVSRGGPSAGPLSVPVGHVVVPSDLSAVNSPEPTARRPPSPEISKARLGLGLGDDAVQIAPSSVSRPGAPTALSSVRSARTNSAKSLRAEGGWGPTGGPGTGPSAAAAPALAMEALPVSNGAPTSAAGASYAAAVSSVPDPVAEASPYAETATPSSSAAASPAAAAAGGVQATVEGGSAAQAGAVEIPSAAAPASSKLEASTVPDTATAGVAAAV